MVSYTDRIESLCSRTVRTDGSSGEWFPEGRYMTREGFRSAVWMRPSFARAFSTSRTVRIPTWYISQSWLMEGSALP
ncbi:hypothetical protein K340107D12_07420 [Blautia parvula]|uniref:Uncharacterized protein n=1 Tax=Blautia parvula TaxID=2877527 RepID=A0ABQ0BN37_9FIRM